MSARSGQSVVCRGCGMTVQVAGGLTVVHPASRQGQRLCPSSRYRVVQVRTVGPVEAQPVRRVPRWQMEPYR
jgi:hypothetical protein